MSKLFITYCLSAILVTLPGCHSASDSCTLPAPERITFTGVGTHGIFDPAITVNPVDNRLWMSYSAVDASAQWPVQNFDVVSTRLAYSDDNGNSWTDTGAVINNVLDVTLPLTPPFDAGTWINEVSQLIYDPGTIAGERWKLLWHHYLLINGERHFEHGWIGLKMADSPENLAAATEIKLFGSYLYDTGNNIAGGASGSPVGGAPLIQLDTALSSALNTCVFTEPGMYRVPEDALGGEDRLVLVDQLGAPLGDLTLGDHRDLGLVGLELRAQAGDVFGLAHPLIVQGQAVVI